MIDAQVPAQSVKWLGETWGFWLQTGALVISAVAAVRVIRAGDRSQQRRATIELVIQQKLDGKLQSAKAYVATLHEKKEGNFAKFLEQPDSVGLDHLMAVLNNYEFIASGIHQDALDGKLFKSMQYSVVIRDWEALKPLVMELRRKLAHETLFQELEQLAVQWKRSPLKKKRIAD
ncbi:MAG: DUF4760 domain-containing protein [Acidobacteriaceae bacterium]